MQPYTYNKDLIHFMTWKLLQHMSLFDIIEYLHHVVRVHGLLFKHYKILCMGDFTTSLSYDTNQVCGPFFPDLILFINNLST